MDALSSFETSQTDCPVSRVTSEKNPFLNHISMETSDIEDVKLSLCKPRTPQFVTQMDTISKRWTLTLGSLMVTSDYFRTRPFLQNVTTGNLKPDCHRYDNAGKVRIKYHNKNLESSSVLTVLVMNDATI